MSRVTYSRMLGIFVMLSLALAGLMLVPAGASAEGMANMKVLVKNQKEENINSALVNAVNVHSGVDYDLSWSESEGWFEADVPPGTYQVFASSEGYISPVEPQMVYGLSEDIEDVPQAIISLTKIDNQADVRIQVNDGPYMFDNGVEDAKVHLFPEDGGHLMMTTTPEGWANFSAPEGFIHVIISYPGMLVYSDIINVSGTFTDYIELDDEPSGDIGSYRIMGLVKNAKTYIPGLEVHIWDSVNGHMVPIQAAEDGAISVPLYSSIFHMLVEAEGYEPIWMENVNLTGGDHYLRPVNNTFKMTPVAVEESKMTTIDMTGVNGIINPTISTEWTMDANSMIYGTPTTFGAPRMQMSGYFPTADWKELTTSEIEDTESALAEFGPAWADTEYFLKVNNEAYSADISGYDVSLTGFEGDITEMGVNPVAIMSTDYTTELAMEEDDDLRIEITALLEGETIEVILPDNYEILGDFDEDEAIYPDGDTSRLMVYTTLEFNAKKEVRPVADLDFISSRDSYKVQDKWYIVKIFENVTFSAEGSYDDVGEIVEYQWIDIPSSARIWIDDENVTYSADLVKELDEITVEFTQNSAEYINISVQVIDSSGLMSKDVDYINVLPDSQAPSITNFTLSKQTDDFGEEWELLSAPFEAMEDTNIEFNATATDNGEIVDYIWTFSDDTGSVNGKIITHNFADPGVFDISLTVIDAAGNKMEAQNKTITISDETEPMSVIKPFDTEGYKVGEEFELNATQSYDPRTTEDVDENLTYKWFWYGENDESANQTLIGTGMVISYTFDEPGVYKINLSVTDSADNEGWSEKILVISGIDLTVINFEFIDPDATELKQDEKVKVSVLIKNIGEIDAEDDFKIVFYRNEDDIKTETVSGGLGAGEDYYWNFSFTPKKSGAAEWKIIIDPDNVINEDNKEDNERIVPATIKETKGTIWDYWYVIPIIIVILIVVYVVYMKFTRGLWGYEPIMEWWNKRNS